MPEGNGTVALAFSGGPDTTVCVPLLKEEYGYDDVIGVTVDVGQPDYEFDEAEETAEALGLDHYVVDATDEFADLCLQAVKANADYQGYPLGTALARPVIAAPPIDPAPPRRTRPRGARSSRTCPSRRRPAPAAPCRRAQRMALKCAYRPGTPLQSLLPDQALQCLLSLIVASYIPTTSEHGFIALKSAYPQGIYVERKQIAYTLPTCLALVYAFCAPQYAPG
jgi:hypothetical protein